MLRKWLFSLLGLIWIGPALAASAVHVNIAAVSGTRQTVAIGQQLPAPFVARATFDDGNPIVGLKLAFSVNFCASLPELPPGSPPCPDPSVYGHFASTAVVATDVLGNAVAPPFTAGTTTGAYTIYAARADWSQLINGQTLTDLPMSPSVSNLFQVVQAPIVAADPVPTLAVPALFALITLIALLALAVRFARRPA
jgi:hypothetical protein